MRRWAAIAAGPTACLVALACTSTAPEDVRPEPDSGAEASSPPPTPKPEAGPDVASPDAGRPKPLDVQCQADPCYVAVSGNGGHHVCGLLHDGTVRCWGRDTLDPPAEPGGIGDGALGRGVAVSILEGATAAPVVGLSSVAQVSVGPNLGTCARTTDGAVYCWGRNEDGQLGRPQAEATLHAPTRVEGLPAVRDVQLGQRIGCAIATESGALYCWGTFSTDAPFAPNAYGVDASPSSSFGPQIVTTMRAPLSSVAVATGGTPAMDTVIALRDDDVLVNIGPHVTGVSTLNPLWQVPLERPSVISVWPYAYLAGDGSLWQWVPVSRTSTAERAYVPSPGQIVDVKMSMYAANDAQPIIQGGALLSTGRLFRWGTNTAGGLGVPPSEKAKAEYPMEVTQLGRQVVSFATTLGAACASLVDGSVQCWGSNAFGDLGRGAVDLSPHSDPEVIR